MLASWSSIAGTSAAPSEVQSSKRRVTALPQRQPLIPPGEGRPLARRFALVCAGSVPICITSALLHAHDGPTRYGVAAAYTFGISLLTWFLVDVGRMVLRGPLGTTGPGYWPKSPARALALVLPAVALGYAGGTAIGDWVAGRSTFELLALNPMRFYGILVASVVISLVSIGFFIQRGRHAAMAAQAQQARLDLLVSQLEPHMLFNTLANLRVLIGRDPGQAQAMLDRLVAYLRSTLAASRATVHPLAAEFARTSDYLALMAVRMGPRLQVKLDLPEALRDLAVPTLLLQPLVENAIAHGLEPSVRGGRVEITARLRQTAQASERPAAAATAPPTLELRVRDTGVGLGTGLPRAAATSGTAHEGGYGLEHVRERLSTLYGPRASITLVAADDEEGGTVAMLTLPAAPANLAAATSPHPASARPAPSA